MKKNIVFFDGICNLCNTSVNFIMRFDNKKQFFFAPLQGETAKKYEFRELTSVIYVNEAGKIFEKSDAALEILSRLFPFGRVFLVFKIIPKFIRDWAYNTIAKHRYQLFGKADTCRVPTEEERTRFLV